MARRQLNVDQYVKTSAALRKAYEDIKFGNIMRSNQLGETFKPILAPLEDIKNKIYEKDSNVSDKDVALERIGDIALRYIKMYTSKDVKTDQTFGLHSAKSHLYIGSEPIVVLENNILFPDGETFHGTEGLWQLICLSEPKDFNDNDYNNYEKIILKTNNYRHNNDVHAKQVKSSRGYKYLNIIKPILQKNGILKYYKKESGSGLRLQKVITNKPVEYVYWNTLDELLEKLYILYGEIKAGNKNPSLYNEIIAILQEIREI